jgi:flagellar biosynthesis component FlhA
MIQGIGIALIGVAAAIETVAGILFVLKVITANPHMPFAMFSGVAFALGGVLLYLAPKRY